MRNKIPIVVFLCGLISVFEFYPQDSIVVASEDTVHYNSNPHPAYLTRLQRDSIINVIPADTSSLIAQRYFDGRLAEKYASDSALNYERNNSKSFFQRLKEMISALLEKLLGTGDISKINELSDKIFHIILAVIFLAAVYFVVRLFMNHRGRWFFEKKNETIPVDLSNVEKHIHEANFDTLFGEAERNGDRRQSVRLLYLWMLKTFTDDHIIEWNPDKTNIDYLAEIKDKALQEPFRYLSYLYSYIWYGEFSINDSEYVNIRESFFRFIKKRPEDE